ncbi:MAG TPA: HAMP domain-containing sensor histidine kinase [Candidatus Eisenbacteria bacterium]|nr:HAMP domain-containing sensor histidine kinase [Candidatus Eisenbacteria bacterium]
MPPPGTLRRPRRRPPWWPEDQPWPPRGRGRRFGPPFFVWRVGCMLVAVAGFAAVATSTAAWLVGSALGIVSVGSGVRPGAVAFLVLVALAVLAAVRGMRRLVSPVGGLVAAAGRIEAGDYSAQVREQGTPELRSVARAFNAMTARLRENEERRRSFLADVTHELRTPLSVIRGQAEAIADGLYPGDAEHLAPIIDAAHALEVLTEDLRTLALSDTGSLALTRELVDLPALAREAAAGFQPRADAAGVTLTVTAEDGVPVVDADPARIRGVIGNLIANALRHTPAGGAVRVAVRPLSDRVRLSVADDGEGIPSELLPRVFDRFVKGPGSTGSGLGLAIARDVVTAHGGTVEIESEPGSGTAIRLELPAPGEG